MFTFAYVAAAAGLLVGGSMWLNRRLQIARGVRSV
jgi:hypothetical protein